MRYLLVFVLALFSFGAVAAPATSTLSWTAPTTRVDSTPLAATEIAEFRIYYGIDIGDTPLAIGPEYTAINGENAAEITVDLTPRPETYVLSFAITTVDTDGLQSVLSETVTKEFEVQSTSKPGAPTSLQFTVLCGDGCTIKKKIVE